MHTPHLIDRQFIREFLYQATLMVNPQYLSFSVDSSDNIFELEPLANLESLAQEVDVSFSILQTDEANLSNRDGEFLSIQAKVSG